MATLEVHDGQGRVQFVELARDHPVLFGTSAACDVLMDGDGIRPVHGRIRWKKRRFRVEASPDAEFVLINGTKMTAGSIHQGDEITVGTCRMFLLRDDETQGSIDLPPVHATDDGRTRVMATPVVPLEPHGEARPSGRNSRSTTRELPPGESQDWMSSLRTQSPVERRRDAAPEVGPLRIRGQAPAPAPASAPPVPVESAPAASGRRGWLERLGRIAGNQAPGEERIASSPVVMGLVASFVILVALGFWLWAIIASTIATQTFNRAIEDYDNGDYRTAIRAFSSFALSHPADPRTAKARVLGAMANVRQFASAEAGTWSSALAATREMVDEVGGLEEYRDLKADLAELVLKAGEGLADRARNAADAKTLAEAEGAVPLHGEIAGEPALVFLNRSRLPAKLSEARAAVRKAETRSRALAAMDKAIAANAPARAFDARDTLVDQYADLGHDKDLIARMTAANELIRRAVVVDSKRRPADRAERTDPLGPPTSLVLRSSLAPAANGLASETIVFALADGFAYAIDGKTGAPLWHRPVGLASSFVPAFVPGEATVLAFDARHGDLLKLDSRTGILIWRLTIGEPVSDRPLVLGNQLVQVLPSGKLLMIALETGELQATVNLGRPLARTPVHDESGQHLYVLGRQDSLFVLARDPLSCVSVDYLGHLDGSIPCEPARLGRFLIIPENETLADSRWHIVLLSDDGVKLKPVQEIAVSGWTWSPPASAGSIVWATGDKGGYEAFAVGDYGSKEPFRSVARLTADASASGPAYCWPQSDRQMWMASGHAGRFELDAEHGKIEPRAPLAQPGPALAPIQNVGRLVVMTFQDPQTSGVALWGIDSEKGTVAWKTIVGAPWAISLAGVAGSSDLSMIGRDGLEKTITLGAISRGGFVVEPMARPGAFALPAGLLLHLEVDGKSIAAVVPGEVSNDIWVQDTAKPGSWRKLGLPAVPAADPIVLGRDILVPGLDSRAYLIDGVTGRSSAEPYVPKFDRDHQGRWKMPARVDHDSVVFADDVGRVVRATLKTAPVPRLVAEAERVLEERIIADPASTGRAVIIATADGHVRSLAARDLSPVGSWKLDAPLTRAPLGIGDHVLVMDRAGNVLAFGPDGQRIWSIKLDSAVIGEPLVRDQLIWFVTRGGKLHVRSLVDGQPREQLDLGTLPAGGLVMAGKEELVPAARGTIRPVVAGALRESQP
jgi:outer membrane protein assembly factor BamB